MKIILSPLEDTGWELSLVRDGETLLINGEAFDFSSVPDGATLPASAIDCDAIIAPVERIDGELHVTVTFPIPWGASNEQRFPGPIVDPADGPITLPI